MSFDPAVFLVPDVHYDLAVETFRGILGDFTEIISKLTGISSAYSRAECFTQAILQTRDKCHVVQPVIAAASLSRSRSGRR